MRLEDLLVHMCLGGVSNRSEATLTWDRIMPHTGGFIEKLGFRVPHIRRALSYSYKNRRVSNGELEEPFRALKAITVSSQAAVGILADLCTSVRNKRLTDADRINVANFFGTLQQLIFPVATLLRVNIDDKSVHVGGNNCGDNVVPLSVCFVSFDFSRIADNLVMSQSVRCVILAT